MKKLFLLSFASVFLLFAGCDQISDLTKVEIPIEGFSIDFGELTIGGELPATSVSAFRASPGYTDFSWTYSLGVDDIPELAPYKSTIQTIESVTIVGASVRIYPIKKEATGDVKGFTIKTGGKLPDFKITSYTLGQAYSSDEFSDFLSKLLTKAITEETVKINLLGETNLPVGEKISAEISATKIVYKINLLKVL